MPDTDKAVIAGVKAILFDWGDTILVDHKLPGKMKDWPQLTAVSNAKMSLKTLSKHYPLYLATNAKDSTLADIEEALEKTELLQYFSGVFCKATLGFGKRDSRFYPTIAERLQLNSNQLLMVGDSLDNDILPALGSGLQAVWLTQSQYEPLSCQHTPAAIISDLKALDKLLKVNK